MKNVDQCKKTPSKLDKKWSVYEFSKFIKTNEIKVEEKRNSKAGKQPKK